MASPERTSRAPAVFVLDVNETLSDLKGLIAHFDAIGADAAIMRLWFTATLRDGFAITAAGGRADFAEVAVMTLTSMLSRMATLRDDPGAAAQRIVAAMAQLDLHPDVADGLRRIRDAGIRVITLSNGSAQVAESLLERAGLRDLVERCLSVGDAGRWKPAPQAYAYAAAQCRAQPDALAMVAVHPWDIDGAHRAGLRTGWISRMGEPYPPFMHAPQAVGTDLPGVAAVLIGEP